MLQKCTPFIMITLERNLDLPVFAGITGIIISIDSKYFYRNHKPEIILLATPRLGIVWHSVRAQLTTSVIHLFIADGESKLCIQYSTLRTIMKLSRNFKNLHFMLTLYHQSLITASIA